MQTLPIKTNGCHNFKHSNPCDCRNGYAFYNVIDTKTAVEINS